MHSVLTNILRAMLFAGICSVVFLVLTLMSSYSIDSTDVQLATFQERIADSLSSYALADLAHFDLNKIMTSDSDFAKGDPIGIRVTLVAASDLQQSDLTSPPVDQSTTPSAQPRAFVSFYNEKYFDVNFGSGQSILSNVRSRTSYRLLTTTDKKLVLATVDFVGLRI